MTYSPHLTKLVDGFDASTNLIIPTPDEKARPRAIKLEKVITEAKVKITSHEHVTKTSLLSLPIRPVLRTPPCAEPYRSLGERFKVCGVELEHIMRALATDENETVDRAFRQFLMVAKLSAVEPLQRAHDIIRNVEEQNRSEQENWTTRTAEVKKQNAKTTRDITRAKKAMDAPWLGVLATLKALLEEDNTIASLHPHDLFMVQAMQKHIGKKLVSTLNGKVRIKFDDLKILSSAFGFKVMDTAQSMARRYHETAVHNWIEDRKNSKQIREILECPGQYGLKQEEINELTRALLHADKRIILITVNGVVCDGGPRVKGEPCLVYERDEFINNGYGRRRGGDYWTTTFDINGDVLEELEHTLRMKRRGF